MGVRLDQDRAVLALDQLVVGRLDASEPVVVGAGVTKHVRRQLTIRVVAPVLLDETDPLELEGGNPLHLLG